MWQGINAVVIEVELSSKLVRRGMRIKRGLECAQFELADGAVVLHDFILPKWVYFLAVAFAASRIFLGSQNSRIKITLPSLTTNLLI